jgi:aldehyde dehydrogenase (NAD+)
VEAASVEDVDKAVAAARKAFKDPSWRDMATTERGDLLYKLSQLIGEHKETLATIETWDNGKPYQVALNEDLGEVANCLKYYAGWADKIHGQVIDTTSAKLAYTIREPIGVCGQIIPSVSQVPQPEYTLTSSQMELSTCYGSVETWTSTCMR